MCEREGRKERERESEKDLGTKNEMKRYEEKSEDLIYTNTKKK